MHERNESFPRGRPGSFIHRPVADVQHCTEGVSTSYRSLYCSSTAVQQVSLSVSHQTQCVGGPVDWMV